MPPSRLANQWRQEAAVLRRRGAQAEAECLESCADDLESTLQAAADTQLTLAEASAASGFSSEHLGRLVRMGRLANAGSRGRPRIRMADLPRRVAGHSKGAYDPGADAQDLLTQRGTK